MKQLKLISKKLADFEARLILSGVYLLVVPIFALFKTKKSTESWEKWQNTSDSLEDLKKQW